MRRCPGTIVDISESLFAARDAPRAHVVALRDREEALPAANAMREPRLTAHGCGLPDGAGDGSAAGIRSRWPGTITLVSVSPFTRAIAPALTRYRRPIVRKPSPASTTWVRVGRTRGAFVVERTRGFVTAFAPRASARNVRGAGDPVGGEPA